MTNQSKNPIFLGLAAIVLGLALGIWGWIKSECIGENCWKGSGLLMWAGGILIAAGLVGWFVFGNRRGR